MITPERNNLVGNNLVGNNLSALRAPGDSRDEDQQCLMRCCASVCLASLFVLCASVMSGKALAESSTSAQASSLAPFESVIGGVDAPSGSFPSIVAIVSTGFFSPASRQFCGGTIVAPTYILTAAHCLFDTETDLLSEASTMRVIGGIENLSEDRGLEETIVTNIFVHPGYTHNRSTQNDIALLELATPLSQPPAPLFLGDRDALDGLPADIVGWGATFFVNSTMAEYPNQLQTAVVPIVPQDVCNAPVSYNNTLIESQFCAGLPEGGVDTCVGDSGGPIYVDINGVREQVGIVSFGRGCAEPNLYGIYTNVTSYQTWLSQFFTVDIGQPRGPRSEPTVGGQAAPGDGSADDDAEPDSEVRRSGGGSLGLLFSGVLGLMLARRRLR